MCINFGRHRVVELRGLLEGHIAQPLNTPELASQGLVHAFAVDALDFERGGVRQDPASTSLPRAIEASAQREIRRRSFGCLIGWNHRVFG